MGTEEGVRPSGRNTLMSAFDPKRTSKAAANNRARLPQISPPPARITSMSLASTRRSGWPRARSIVRRGSIPVPSISWTARAASSVGTPRRKQVAGFKGYRGKSIEVCAGDCVHRATDDPASRLIHGQLAWKWDINESGLKLIAAITEQRKSCRIGLKRSGNG